MMTITKELSIPQTHSHFNWFSGLLGSERGPGNIFPRTSLRKLTAETLSLYGRDILANNQ